MSAIVRSHKSLEVCSTRCVVLAIVMAAQVVRICSVRCVVLAAALRTVVRGLGLPRSLLLSGCGDCAVQGGVVPFRGGMAFVSARSDPVCVCGVCRVATHNDCDAYGGIFYAWPSMHAHGRVYVCQVHATTPTMLRPPRGVRTIRFN